MAIINEESAEEVNADEVSESPPLPKPKKSKASSKKEITRIAQECMDGMWRTGRDRDELLKMAGHDPEQVRQEFNRLRGEARKTAIEDRRAGKA